MERDRDQDTTLLSKLKRARRGESNAKVLVNTLATQLKVVPLPRRRYPAATPPPLPRRRYPSSTTNPHWQIATEVYTKASVEVSELHKRVQEEQTEKDRVVKEELDEKKQLAEVQGEVAGEVEGETTEESEEGHGPIVLDSSDEELNDEQPRDAAGLGTLACSFA